MTAVIDAPTQLVAPDAPKPRRDVFVADDARSKGRFGAARKRLAWPLGIYTMPVAILVVWEILALAKVLKPTYAPAQAHRVPRRWPRRRLPIQPSVRPEHARVPRPE